MREEAKIALEATRERTLPEMLEFMLDESDPKKSK